MSQESPKYFVEPWWETYLWWAVITIVSGSLFYSIILYSGF